jgi:hypothetical protein
MSAIGPERRVCRESAANTGAPTYSIFPTRSGLSATGTSPISAPVSEKSAFRQVLVLSPQLPPE